LKTLNKILAAALVVLMTGCGGGGGDSSSGTTPVVQNPTTPTTPTTPVSPSTPATVTNPLTGSAAPGSATTTLYGSAYDGASVTAYNVQPDGSSGAAIAGPVTAASGVFTLNFATAPTGWVRIVATGGSKPRVFDSTVQPGGTMQLVTPFITTTHNNLKITPLTDIAANVMEHNAKKGAALADAFKTGMRTMLELDSANVLMMSDTSVYLNVLKGAIQSDTSYNSAQSPQSTEMLNGLDLLGVALDMPTKDVMRVVGATAQGSYPLNALDGSGNVINAGAWVGGSFDSAAAQSLNTLMDAKVPDSQKRSAGGSKVAPRMNEYVSQYMIMTWSMNNACINGATQNFANRYPFYVLTSQGKISDADCAAADAWVSELRARVATNQSSKMK